MLTSLYSSTYIQRGFRLEEDNKSADTESDVVNEGERNSLSVLTITSVGGSNHQHLLHYLARSRPAVGFWRYLVRFFYLHLSKNLSCLEGPFPDMPIRSTRCKNFFLQPY